MRRISNEITVLLRQLAKVSERTGDLTVLHAFGARVAEEVPAAVAGAAGNTARVEAARLVGEISHSLNTPLALIEATALLLDDGQAQTRPNAQVGQDLLIAVGICKAFLNGYRELYKLGLAWAPTSLGGTLAAAADIYSRRAGNAVTSRIDLPNDFRGYSNNFLVTMLLPLVQNAVEASPGSGGQLVVWSVQRHGRLIVRVQNDNNGSVLIDSSIYNSTVTTKSGNHEGVGLDTVARLASSVNGKLSHEISEETTTFNLNLPRRHRR